MIRGALWAFALIVGVTLAVVGIAYAVVPSPTMQFPTNGWGGYAPALVQCGTLIGANMNSTADQAITITNPTTNYSVDSIEVSGASVSLTTAAGGIYPAAAKAGTALVANSQAYSTLTAAAVDATGSTLVLTLASGISATMYDLPVLYFSLTTGQGSAATANIRVRCRPHYR